MTRSKRQKALHEIAEAFGIPEKERTARQRVLTWDGICNGMAQLNLLKGPGMMLLSALKADTGSSMLCTPYYSRSWTRKNDLWRADLASFLAAMSDKEYNRTFGEEM